MSHVGSWCRCWFTLKIYMGGSFLCSSMVWTYFSCLKLSNVAICLDVLRKVFSHPTTALLRWICIYKIATLICYATPTKCSVLYFRPKTGRRPWSYTNIWSPLNWNQLFLLWMHWSLHCVSLRLYLTFLPDTHKNLWHDLLEKLPENFCWRWKEKLAQ